MALAVPMQKFQDWFTQQWVIIRGKRIDPEDVPWLIGPFAKPGEIGDAYIEELAETESLLIQRRSRGLIPSISLLNLPEPEFARLSKPVIDFYENTANFDLSLSVTWTPLSRKLGSLVKKLFSNRLNQLNIPTKNVEYPEPLTSEIITLVEPQTNEVMYTIWFRKLESSGEVIHSGVYGTCDLPSGETCVKAVFPLPHGNATILLSPSVGANGELVLESSGKKFGDAGFYFLLKDSSGNLWSQFIRSFRDRLTIRAEDDRLSAEQTMTLWNRQVLSFKYEIVRKSL